ncbi:hypothetical protein [Marinomonas aquimarina]|uniref:hypothetical protein n=1 Tax=Marinomonas aquimarina TaxID=295068 RepID=UPI0008376EDB|nr:hypothetical protein [Marinomonas aquimarina]
MVSLQRALADAFLNCYDGKSPAVFQQAAQHFLASLPQQALSEDDIELIRGSVERIALSLNRSASAIAVERSQAPALP